MRTYITSCFLMFFISMGVNAQIDRSKQPKPGPVPKIELKKPNTFNLDNGLTVMVVEDNILPRVSYSLRIDNNPIAEGKKAGVSSILGAMLGNGTTSIPKDSFNDEVDFMGANISFGSQSAFASGLSKYSERIMELMADAAINPLLTEEEFEKEKTKLLEGIRSQDKSVAAIAGNVGSALSYGLEHPYGEFATEETVNNISFEDVKSFYNNYFSPSNAYLVVIGDIDKDTVKELTKKYFGNWSSTSKIEIPIVNPRDNVSSPQINFVDAPNAVQSDISITNNVKLKMNDKDYHAALLTNYILGGGGDGYLYQNLREDKGFTYGAYSQLGASKYGAARFNASTEVRNEVTDSAIVEAISEIKRIRNEKVDPETLEIAKAKYVGGFVMALERPQTIANYALNIELNDLDDDFYKDYLENINAVTVDDVHRVANKYLKPDNLRIVVVGKGSEVLEGLENLGYPIEYYNKHAQKVEKPVFSKPLPEGVSAKTVFNNYIKAIGGKEKLESVKTLYNTAEVSIENIPMKLSAELKSMVPNKESMEMSAEGMGVLMKQKFDGESGYMEQQGQKSPLTEEQIGEKKAEISIFPELHYSDSDVSLESIVTINGKDAYKVKVMKGDKASFRYYDVDTSLLTRVESTTEAQGQTITSIVDFDNYQEVNGIMLPMSQRVEAGPQKINLNITSAKINEGVSETDFQ